MRSLETNSYADTEVAKGVGQLLMALLWWHESRTPKLLQGWLGTEARKDPIGLGSFRPLRELCEDVHNRDIIQDSLLSCRSTEYVKLEGGSEIIRCIRC